MADVPANDSKRTPAPEATGALARLQDELRTAEKTDAEKSLLRIAVDKVTEPFHHSSAAVKNLRELSQNSTAPDFAAKTTEAIKAEKLAQSRERDTYSFTDSALKSLGMFTAKRLGVVLTGAVAALDEIRPHDSDHITSDAIFGLTKGLLERQVNFSLAKRELNPTTAALGMGVVNRFIDTALTRTNLSDKAGDMSWSSIGQGLFDSAKAAASPEALKGDMAAGALAYPLTRGLNSTFAGNAFKRAATTGFVYGYSQGLVDELQSSKNGSSGSLFSSPDSLAHLALYPLARGVASSIGAMPGGERQYVKEYAWDNALKTNAREYQLISINPADVKAINTAKGKPVDVNINAMDTSMGLKPAESISIGKQNVPTDWYSRFFDTFKMKGKEQSSAPQMRFISRDPAQPGSAENQWQMVTAPGFKTVSDLQPHLGEILPTLKEPLVGYLGGGAQSYAFQMAGGPVLKMTDVFSAKDYTDWGKLPFDAKTLSEQFVTQAIPDRRYRGNNSDGQIMYLQEFVKMNGTQQDALSLREAMAQKKINFHDFDLHLRGEQVSSAVEQFGFGREESDKPGEPPKSAKKIVDYPARRVFPGYVDPEK